MRFTLHGHTATKRRNAHLNMDQTSWASALPCSSLDAKGMRLERSVWGFAPLFCVPLIRVPLICDILQCYSTCASGQGRVREGDCRPGSASCEVQCEGYIQPAASVLRMPPHRVGVPSSRKPPIYVLMLPSIYLAPATYSVADPLPRPSR